MQSVAMPFQGGRKPFATAGAAAGIGSLPLASVPAAIRSVAEFSPEVPFWPRLPQISAAERAIGRGLSCLADLAEPGNEGYGYRVQLGQLNAVLEALHDSRRALTSKDAAGFGAFESALLSGLISSATVVKGQIEGPITLSVYLVHQGRPFLSDSALIAAVASHVSEMISCGIEHLQVADLPVPLFVDELALCLEVFAHVVSEEQRINTLGATEGNARVRGAYAGLRCCAVGPFELMRHAKPDIPSFDAHEGLDVFFAGWHALDFAEQEGTVAYGLVPTRTGLNAAVSASIYIR